jgi:hypothetical protein
MHKFLVLSLAVALGAPAFAQKSGSINRNAPTIAQTVTAGDAKISLNYTSIAWGMGQTFEAAMDKENGAQAREGINNAAKRTPLGDFSTNVDLKCGELNIPAGDYKVSFTINDKTEWHINFTGAQTLSMKLPLMDNKEQPHKKLLLCLYAGDTAGAGAYIAFGTKFAILAFEPSGAKKG